MPLMPCFKFKFNKIPILHLEAETPFGLVFASSPWKLVTNYVLEWMGLNFYYNDGLQSKMRAGIINEHECSHNWMIWSDQNSTKLYCALSIQFGLVFLCHILVFYHTKGHFFLWHLQLSSQAILKKKSYHWKNYPQLVSLPIALICMIGAKGKDKES